LALEEIQDTMQLVGFVDVHLFTKPDTEWNAILAQKKLQYREKTI
jgi:hypothetical protein